MKNSKYPKYYIWSFSDGTQKEIWRVNENVAHWKNIETDEIWQESKWILTVVLSGEEWKEKYKKNLREITLAELALII